MTISLRVSRARILVVALAIAVLLVGLISARRASGATLAKKLWAVVKADGTLARSANTTGSTRLATGEYDIDFNRHVDNCVWVATLANPGGGGPPAGEIGVALRNATTNGLFVQARTSSGTNMTAPFHLLVICPGT